jgi:hypothetical protein
VNPKKNGFDIDVLKGVPMGCDIHSFAERKNAAGEWQWVPGLEPFGDRSYGTFGWLADVRNYSAIPPIAEQRGFPGDASPEVAEDYDAWGGDAHSPSWLTVAELLSFDYEAVCEDRRTTKQLGPNFWTGAATCEEGEGARQTYREFLGARFFEDLRALQEAGAERIVFWFDN